jgi:hypothetical protein
MILLGTGEVVAEVRNHSGTVVSTDRVTNTIVIGEIGPWRLKDGATDGTRHAVTITPVTMFVLAGRVPGPGPNGWIGDFAEELLAPWALREGDFVTVLCQHDGRFLTALEIVVTAIGE